MAHANHSKIGSNCGSDIEFLSEKDSLIPRKEVITWCPSLKKTSQLVITYKCERGAFECIWGWAAGSYHRGALAPRHKWMERAQCNGETEPRCRDWCAVNRGKREETVAWDKGGMNFRINSFNEELRSFFSEWHGFVPIKMRFLQRWHSTWEKWESSRNRTYSRPEWKEKREFYSFRNFFYFGFSLGLFFFFAFFYLTSIGCERTHSEIWIWSMHFCFSSCQTVWQWLCRYPLAPLWTSIT